MDLEDALLVVGAPAAAPEARAPAYAWFRSGNDWVLAGALAAPAGASRRFGEAVAIGGTRVFVSDPASGRGGVLA